MDAPRMKVSIVIPVLNRLEFTRQCLDRIWLNTEQSIAYEVIVVDNGSTDGTAEWFSATTFPHRLQYRRNAENLGFAKANNIGASLATGHFLLFLNNDTLVQPGWLTEMLRVADADSRVGIVGIKQLFPYTNTIYHTGMVFTQDSRPEHLYPHLDASLPKVNKQREYQAVMGACLLIERGLFDECGGFDEAYRNGYEDVDLCMKARQRGRKIVCCTKAFIYHYGQISEGRTRDDDRNAALFASRWAKIVKPDRDEYLIRDRAEDDRPSASRSAALRRLADDCVYLADALDDGSALTWINAELALALQAKRVPVFVNGDSPLSPTLSSSDRRQLAPLALKGRPFDGVQVKWSHYRPRHLNLDLAGAVNLEFFVINYVFAGTSDEPWDYWLQCLRQNGYDKLPLSEFCESVLAQVGVSEARSHLWYPGYSREVDQVGAPARRESRFRFLTVTNSHDLARYNTAAILDAYERTFSRRDDVVMVVKDYGASSGDVTIRRRLKELTHGPAIEYVSEFSDKRALMRLYKSCDAFVSAHRGEGFGMKILDAMACGVPVLTPLFGGPTAYCRSDNCYSIDFSLVSMDDCLDTRALHIANRPMWAEVDVDGLARQMRAVYDDRTGARTIGERGRDFVAGRFSWGSSADRFLEIASALRADRPLRARASEASPPAATSPSPYWLGLRVSVAIPTRNRKDKLLTCLDALADQSVLPQEYEVLVVDDGSTDGTAEALRGRNFPFTLRYFRQEAAGPGTARNLAIDQALGEIVLFIGDDIYADRRLLEQHLLGHATRTDPAAAVLGRIDWPAAMAPNAVMQYVCGEGMLQFAYDYIPQLAALDHRFFYTSNISLKRSFLVDAAGAGVRFDPAFRRAAFEDSEFAFRLARRGLTLHYAEAARAAHDHWMDLDSFAAREDGAGEMAVVFYRKHPEEDPQLQVRWIADLVEPSIALLQQPELLQHLDEFDRQTDGLLRALAASLEELTAIDRPLDALPDLTPGHLRIALHNVLHIVFDVARTRGKVREWFANVDAAERIAAAQTVAAVLRKIEFLRVHGSQLAAAAGGVPVDRQALADLSGRIATVQGMPRSAVEISTTTGGVRRRLRRLVASPFVVSTLLKTDRAIERRLQASAPAPWLERYRRARRRLRGILIS
jgi:GT2 family glycosyltransferase/glycosyltransferase involved in cell wall biosynthesis